MFLTVRGRFKRSDSTSSIQASETKTTRYYETSTIGDTDGLWQDALDDYRRSLGIDLRDLNIRYVFDLERCRTSEDILEVLQDVSDGLSERRQGSPMLRGLRAALEPLVHGLRVILEASADTASGLIPVPGGQGIFAAVAVLLKAADRVKDAFDDLEKLLQRLHVFVERLQVRVRVQLQTSSRKIAVKALVEMLKAFEISTRMLNKGRIRHFVDALFSRDENVKSALEALADVTSEEERMAIAELVVDVHHLASDVKNIGSSVRTLHVALDMFQTESRADSKDILSALQETNRINNETLVAMKTLAQVSASQRTRSQTMLKGTKSAERQSLVSRRAVHGVLPFIHLLRLAVSRFSPEDQAILWRAFETLLSWAVAGASLASSSGVVQTVATVTGFTHAVEMVIPKAFKVLLLFMAQKLFSVSRPPGRPDDTVLIVDVLGEPFVLRPETFSSWEKTHEFLLNAFKDREGASYVQRGDYGLGNSERLLIEPQAWKEVVKPGTKLKMGIILRELAPHCPYCGAPTTGHELSSGDGSIVCIPCKHHYGAYRGIKEVPGPDSQEDNSSKTSERKYQTIAGVAGPASGAKHSPNYDSSDANNEILVPPRDVGDDTYLDDTMHLFQRVLVEYQNTSMVGLRLHVPSDEGLQPVRDALAMEARLQQQLAMPSIVLSAKSQAYLSVHAKAKKIVYTIIHPLMKVHGVGRLDRPTRAESRLIYSVLHAANIFFWHLNLSKDTRRYNPLSVSFHEVRRDAMAEYDKYMRPPFVAHGANLLRSGRIDVVADDRTCYGITLSNLSNLRLHIWVFYFDCGDLSISEYCRPVVCEARGKLLMGHGTGVGNPYTFYLPQGHTRDIGFIKIYASKKAIDLSAIAQDSPFRDKRKLPNPLVASESMHAEVFSTSTLAIVQT